MVNKVTCLICPQIYKKQKKVHVYAHTHSNSKGEEGELQKKGEERRQRQMEGGVRVFVEGEKIVLAQALVVKLQ